MLHRTPRSNIQDPITIDDSDKILSIHVLQVLMAFYTQCDDERLKPRVINDLYMII